MRSECKPIQPKPSIPEQKMLRVTAKLAGEAPLEIAELGGLSVVDTAFGTNVRLSNTQMVIANQK